MTTKKDRRHNGWQWPNILCKPIAYLAQPYWDDWVEYRDGQRDKRERKSSWKDKTKKRRQYM